MIRLLHAARAYVRGLPPRRLDAALAAAVFVEAMIEAAIAGGSFGARAAVAGPAALMAAAVAWRRRDSITAIALGAAALVLVSALSEHVSDALGGPYIAWMFVVYSHAAHSTDKRRMLIGIAVALVGVVLITVTEDDAQSLRDALAGFGIFVAAPTFAGRMLNGRLLLTRALRDRSVRLAAESDDRIQQARLAERTRIAGELHDVVAHALGAMTVQAGAARRLATKDPVLAGEALGAVETAGRGALGELRTLLDVLRGDETEPEFEPQPSLAGLALLADRARAAGLPVELHQHGEAPAGFPASVDLTAYRVVQEALEAARHPGGATAASVTVGFTDDALDIEIVDDGAPGMSRQLLGLRERVRLYGGEVDAGPRDGRHVVRAHLPLKVPA